MFSTLKQFHQLHLVIRFLLLGTMIMRAARSMSIPFLAIYLHQRTGLPAGQIGVIIGLGFLASTIGGVFGGSLSDRIGRKRVMLIALFSWGIVFILFGTVNSIFLFVLLNIFNGLCHSFFEPVSKALMIDLSQKTDRYRIFSLRYLAINVGAAIGPLLGTYFGIVASPTPFFITGGVYLIYAVIIFVILKKVTLTKQKLGSKEFNLEAVWQTIKRDKPLRFYVLGGIIWMFCYSQIDSTLLQYLNRDFTEGVKIFSIIITINAIIVMIFQIPVTKYFEKFNPLTSIAVGNILFLLGNVVFALSSNWSAFIFSMLFFTMGEILSFPAMNVLMDEIAPDSMRGTYYGVQNLYNIGQFIGPWLGGIMLESYGGRIIFLTVATLVLIVLYAYWLGRRKYLLSENTQEHEFTL